MAITLLTSHYAEQNQDRLAEFLECLRRNHENSSIDEIHLWVEAPIELEQLVVENPFLAHRSITLIPQSDRPTFRALLDYANSELRHRIVALANSDIYFDETLKLLIGRDLTGWLLCLSRWDVHPDGNVSLFNHSASQDAWIFQAPIPGFPCDFPMGVPGCDNRLAWEARQSGLRLANPSQSIRAFHLHLSNVRHYTSSHRVSGPGWPIEPATLDTSRFPPFRQNSQNSLNSVMTAHSKKDEIIAATSLAPALWRTPMQKQCIASWRKAGLRVLSFNHPSEIGDLKSRYDVEWIPVEDTSNDAAGRCFVPLHAILNWAAHADANILLLNADIELRLEPWEMKRIRWLAGDGLCFLVRYNHSGNIAQATREPWGIDGFFLCGRHANLAPNSFLSLGMPWWDYVLPHFFHANAKDLWKVDYPAAFHRSHPQQWAWEQWHRCGAEFSRIAGNGSGNPSDKDVAALSWRLRELFEREARPIARQPMPIRPWVERTFNYSEKKIFFELGSHLGTDTQWMAALPDVTIHAFEPDPRNSQVPRPNVLQNRLAVGAHDGKNQFILSQHGWGQVWTHSSSIHAPKNHLQRYPVTFGDHIEVDLTTLDTYCEQHGIDRINFIWADIQGAEGDMIQGGAKILRRTHYLFTEYSDDELYAGQATLRDIMDQLPEFRVVELWPDDVLLENRHW